VRFVPQLYPDKSIQVVALQPPEAFSHHRHHILEHYRALHITLLLREHLPGSPDRMTAGQPAQKIHRPISVR
jgi:hypothetical protein